jgi:GTP 3',8-cyclase
MNIAKHIYSVIPHEWFKVLARFYMLATRLDYHHFLNIHLETCAQCNRRCHYCPQSKDPFQVEFMSEELIQISLRRMRAIDWNGPIILCVFNEPLLDKRIPDIIKECRAVVPKAFPQLFSNGDLINEELAASLVKSGLGSCVITPHPPYKEGWTQRVDAVCKRWPEVFKVNGGITPYRVGGLNALPTNRKTSCDYQEWSFVIRHNGKVPLCCIDYGPETNLGNIRDHDIYSIWYEAKFMQMRRELRAGRYSTKVCKDCFQAPDSK